MWVFEEEKNQIIGHLGVRTEDLDANSEFKKKL